MSNPKNIEPFSKLVHDAAQGGGPEKFLEDMAQKNYALGVAAEKKTEIGKGTALLIVGIGIWEVTKWCAKKIKNYFEENVEKAYEEAKEANENCISKVNELNMKQVMADDACD